MARKKAGAGGPGALPQREDVWLVVARESRLRVAELGPDRSPWFLIALSTTARSVLGLEVLPDAPGPDQAWALLGKAMAAPLGAEPHRPTAVAFASPDWADALRPRLKALGITCGIAEELGAVDAMLEDLEGRVAGPRAPHPGPLDVPGVSPEMLAALYDAAAVFYESAPWKKVGERPIRVECPRLDSGPWFAVLMGQAGVTPGLVLYDDLDFVHDIQLGELSDEELARRTASLTVVFGPEEEMASGEHAAWQKHHWRVAGPGAFPSAYRVDPGLAIRPLLAWEVTLMEGCLRVLPEFVRKKTRRVGPATYAAPVSSGELPLVLSWAD